MRRRRLRLAEAEGAGTVLFSARHPADSTRAGRRPTFRILKRSSSQADTSAERSASGPATPTPRSGHANAHPRATAPPGQFRKLDALAVLTGPLFPAPRYG